MVNTKFGTTGLYGIEQKSLIYYHKDYKATSVDNVYKYNVYTNYSNNIYISTIQGIIFKPVYDNGISGIVAHHDNAIFIKETYVQYYTESEYNHIKDMYTRKHENDIKYSHDVPYTHITWDRDNVTNKYCMILNVITIIPEKTMIRKNTLYLQDVGIVLNVGKFPDDYKHPLKGRNLYDLFESYNGNHCYFELIDNENIGKLYYTKVGGRLMILTSTTSELRHSGLYFSTKIIGSTPTEVEIGMNELDKHGVYTTKHDAINAEEYIDTAVSKELRKTITNLNKDISKLSDKKSEILETIEVRNHELRVSHEKEKISLDEKLSKYRDKVNKSLEELDDIYDVKKKELDDYLKRSSYDEYVVHCDKTHRLAQKSLMEANIYIKEAVREKIIKPMTQSMVKEFIDKLDIKIPIHIPGLEIT